MFEDTHMKIEHVKIHVHFFKNIIGVMVHIPYVRMHCVSKNVPTYSVLSVCQI